MPRTPKQIEASTSKEKEAEESSEELDDDLDESYKEGEMESSSGESSQEESPPPKKRTKGLKVGAKTKSCIKKKTKEKLTRSVPWSKNEIDLLFTAAIPHRALLRAKHITYKNEQKENAIQEVQGKFTQMTQ